VTHLSVVRPAAPRFASASTFNALYEDWFESVSRWVQALGVPPADCADVVQEVFLVAHRRLAQFDGENPAGWLFQIARRKVRDHRRLVWVEHFFGHRRVPVREGVLTTNQSPFEELVTKRRQQLLVRSLDRLDEKQRAAFVLFEIEGRRGAEIARMSGVPLSTVWLRLHRARKALHQRGARQSEGAA
jgi:RNA polymerase sigma-70 factor (ECF subfamily)